MSKAERLILFDLDGTIIDQRAILLKCLNEVLRDYNVAYTLEELTPLIGTPMKDVIKKKVKSERVANELRERYKEIYLKNYLKGLRIYSGMIDLIKDLKSKNFKLGIVTSRYGIVARKLLNALKIFDLFDVVIGEGDTDLKPSPMPVLYACRALKAKPKNCIVIGDSVNDVVSGKGANCTTVAVLWGYGEKDSLLRAKPDYVVNSPKELRKILISQNKKVFI